MAPYWSSNQSKWNNFYEHLFENKQNEKVNQNLIIPNFQYFKTILQYFIPLNVAYTSPTVSL